MDSEFEPSEGLQLPKYKRFDSVWKICQTSFMLKANRRIVWITAALKDFKKFPKPAQEKIFDALILAAQGEMGEISKPMKELGSGVFEVALKYRSDAYRTVYAVQIDNQIWVIHAFKKKSKTAIKTPKPETDLIKKRIKALKKELKG